MPAGLSYVIQYDDTVAGTGTWPKRATGSSGADVSSTCIVHVRSENSGEISIRATRPRCAPCLRPNWRRARQSRARRRGNGEPYTSRMRPRFDRDRTGAGPIHRRDMCTLRAAWADEMHCWRKVPRSTGGRTRTTLAARVRSFARKGDATYRSCRRHTRSRRREAGRQARAIRLPGRARADVRLRDRACDARESERRCVVISRRTAEPEIGEELQRTAPRNAGLRPDVAPRTRNLRAGRRSDAYAERSASKLRKTRFRARDRSEGALPARPLRRCPRNPA